MEDGTRRVGHLVELVDAAHATVAQHECATLQHHLTRLGVLRDVRRETDRRGALATRVDTSTDNM